MSYGMWGLESSGRARMFQGNCCLLFENVIFTLCRSRWPYGLRRRSAADCLLRLWVRIPPRTWMFVCCECCVLSGRGLCDELITRPEESYRLLGVVVCDLETSRGGPGPLEAVAPNNNNNNISIFVVCKGRIVHAGQVLKWFLLII